jgi:signal transduction histidine kinase
VLLVEDDAGARQLYETAIGAAGWGCLACGSAEEALERLTGAAVVAAVLDVQLPGMSGIELASRLKADRDGGALFPVILISGSGTSSERVQALSAGVDDFLVKPIDLRELEVRLRAQLERRAEVEALARANRQLRDLERKKRELATLVVHDLRNPIAGVLGAAELLTGELQRPAPDHQHAIELAGEISQLARKALSLLHSMLDVEELEEGMLLCRMEQVWVAEFLAELVRPYRPIIASRGMSLELDTEGGLAAQFDPGLVGRVVENLLDNAVRYAARRGRVAIRGHQRGSDLVIEIGNDGPRIPPDTSERIFERYFRIEERRASARENRGLGLYFCRLAAEAHKGSIAVASEPDLPTLFVLRLPQPA